MVYGLLLQQMVPLLTNICYGCLRAGPLPDNAVLVLHAQKARSSRPKQTVTKSVWNIAWETYCFFVLFSLVL